MNCFQDLVGITNLECNCSQPDGSETLKQWRHETFVAGDSPGAEITFEADYKILSVEVYEDGVTIGEGRVTFTGKTFTVSDPPANAYYQLWYECNINNVFPSYNVSLSGLYLSDILPINETKALEKCDVTYWEELQRKREVAIKEVVASLNVSTKSKAKDKYQKFNGYIGTEQSDSYLTTDKAYSVIRIRTNPIRSGFLRIRRAAAFFEKSGEINCWIYNSEGTVVTPMFQLRTTQGGRKTITEIGVTLDMLSDFNTCQDYFLVYEYDPANRPKLNKTYCAPCNKSNLSPITYVNRYGLYNEWPDDYRGQIAWNNFLIVGGFETDSVDDFSDAPDTVSTYMNGLALEVEIGCDLTKGYCTLIEGQGPEVMAIATAIQRRWASLVVSEKSISSVPNRETIAKGDAQKSMADVWEGEFAEAMNYLSKAINDTSNDCVMCKPKMSMGKIMT